MNDFLFRFKRTFWQDGRKATVSMIIGFIIFFLIQLVTRDYITVQVLFFPALAIDNFQIYRFITYAFAHDTTSPLHIVFNMYSLYILGSIIEKFFGTVRFLIIFWGSVLGGSIFSVVINSITGNYLWTMIGASGGIFGLMTSLLVLFNKLGLRSNQIMFVIMINLMLTFIVPSIAWQAHIGGGLTGLGISYLFLKKHGFRSF